MNEEKLQTNLDKISRIALKESLYRPLFEWMIERHNEEIEYIKEAIDSPIEKYSPLIGPNEADAILEFKSETREIISEIEAKKGDS